MDWIVGMQKAIDYIENHLTEKIDYDKVAAQSLSSSYHFQRVFSILCGFTIGEYIRNRRLSIAGSELATTDARVIDVALKYGYENPDSFAKAFKKFHGILPSQARNNGSMLKSYSHLVLNFSFEGGMTMNYRIEERETMVVTGCSKRFLGNPSDRYNQQHDFMVSADVRFIRFAMQGMSSDCSKEYAVISNINENDYDFTIGTVIPNYFNEHLSKIIGDSNTGKLNVIKIPANKYLIIETERSALSIQDHLDIRKQVIAEWFKDSQWQLRMNQKLQSFITIELIRITAILNYGCL